MGGRVIADCRETCSDSMRCCSIFSLHECLDCSFLIAFCSMSYEHLLGSNLSDLIS